jgi:hypothetical protein
LPGENKWLPKYFRYGNMACIAVLSLFLVPVAQAQSEPEVLITKAQTTFSNFVRDPDMTWIQNNLRRAKGVLITPEIVKVGFIFGGSGGRALLVARDATTNEWRGPAFYTLATASVGFQAGVAVSENVTLVMTEKGMNTLFAPSVKLGGDASVAAGPCGRRRGRRRDQRLCVVLAFQGRVRGPQSRWYRHQRQQRLEQDLLRLRTSFHRTSLCAATSRATRPMRF